MIKKQLFVLVFFVNFCLCQNAEVSFLHSINQNEKPKWDLCMVNTSKSIYYIWPTTIIFPAGHGFIKSDNQLYRAAVKNALCIGLSSGISGLAKITFHRTRPSLKYPNLIVARDHAGVNSFPSGHTTTAFASATAISLTYPKWYVIVPSYLYAGLVGYSRMRLGMHYPTDVLTGAVIGTVIPILVWKADKIFQRKRKRKTV